VDGNRACTLSALEIAFYYLRSLLEPESSWPETVESKLVSSLSRIRFFTETTRNRPPLGWGYLFRNSCNSECSLQFDRTYALNGLADKHWQLQPTYEISEKELLRNVLQSELAAQIEKNCGGSIDYFDLGKFIEGWPGFLNFQPVRPSGWIDRDLLERPSFERIRYNVHLVSIELGIPVPAKPRPLPAALECKEKDHSKEYSEGSKTIQ
jgi:hypothetical protein